MRTLHILSAAGALLATTTVFAADTSAAALVQQNLQQEQQIEQGLQSGALTAEEAGRLEHDEARIDHAEAHALANDKVSAKEQSHIDAKETAFQSALSADTQNVATASPTSAQSELMQTDVAKNITEQQSIEQVAESATAKDKAVGTLEHGQAKLDNREAAAASNDMISDREQRHIDRAAAHQGARIARR